MCRRILVVDDDRALRSLLQALLESEGYTVDTASDGQIAWEKLHQPSGSYEAVLLDMQMPRMDGLHLIRVLRQQEAGWVDQLMAMSADREALQQARELGVSRVLEKPIDLEALLAVLATRVA